MTDPEPTLDIESASRAFADEVSSTVVSCLSGDMIKNFIEYNPEKKLATIGIVQELKVPSAGTAKTSKVGAHLILNFQLGTDGSGQYLAVETSSFQLGLKANGRDPIIRIEYNRSSRNKPSSHIHLHAHSGPLTKLLEQARHPASHAIQSLHFPTGGHRFRPCVEDFIQFLITDCQVLSEEGWEERIETGRAQWRERQTASVVRDRPDIARQVLDDHVDGYQSHAATGW